MDRSITKNDNPSDNAVIQNNGVALASEKGRGVRLLREDEIIRDQQPRNASDPNFKRFPA